MKHNKSFVFRMLAMAMGLFIAGCATTGNGEAADALDGTKWGGTAFNFDSVSEGGGPSDGGTYTLTFNSPNWLMVRGDGGNIVKGTYSVSGRNITFTTTHEYWGGGNAGWHDVNPDGYHPKTGTFTGATMTIVCGGDSSLTYTKK
jgi:hypothetical protein